jgi:hypothetical protein
MKPWHQDTTALNSRATPFLNSVKDFPPGKELTTAECERILVTLLVENVLDTNVVWTKYRYVFPASSGGRSWALL